MSTIELKKFLFAFILTLIDYRAAHVFSDLENKTFIVFATLGLLLSALRLLLNYDSNEVHDVILTSPISCGFA